MKKLLFSFLVLGITSVLAIGATTAYFSDTEVSAGNTFTAGTLDLKLDDNEVNVRYIYSNMIPSVTQPNITYRLRNDGSINGFLNIKNIIIKSSENGCLEPEVSAGDDDCGNGSYEGELNQVLNLRLMHDANCNGWYEQPVDTILFQGLANTIASQYLPNISIPAGQEICINVLINWWNTANDNLAQGDDMTLDMGFELNQLKQL